MFAQSISLNTDMKIIQSVILFRFFRSSKAFGFSEEFGNDVNIGKKFHHEVDVLTILSLHLFEPTSSPDTVRSPNRHVLVLLSTESLGHETLSISSISRLVQVNLCVRRTQTDFQNMEITNQTFDNTVCFPIRWERKLLKWLQWNIAKFIMLNKRRRWRNVWNSLRLACQRVSTCLIWIFGSNRCCRTISQAQLCSAGTRTLAK